jgi:hypothetical protein
MYRHGVGLTVLVNKIPLQEYQQDDATFVEGRPGIEYELEIRNNNYHRVEVVLSLDGLSLIDGRPAAVTSRGVVLDPYTDLCVPHRLVFADRARARRSAGVIGALVFDERVDHPVTMRWDGTIVSGRLPVGAFHRAIRLTAINIYYDTANRLRRRGVPIAPPRPLKPLPAAFKDDAASLG